MDAIETTATTRRERKQERTAASRGMMISHAVRMKSYDATNDLGLNFSDTVIFTA